MVSPFSSKCHLMTPRWHPRCHLLKLYTNWNFAFFVKKVTLFWVFRAPLSSFELFVFWKFLKSVAWEHFHLVQKKYYSSSFRKSYEHLFWKEHIKVSPFSSKCHLLTQRWHPRCHLLKLYTNWQFEFFVKKVTLFENFVHLCLPMKFSYFWNFPVNISYFWKLLKPVIWEQFLIINYNFGKISDLCAFMSKTTDLCKTLQIYVTFIKTMHEFLIFGKCCKLSNLCSIMHEIIKSMCKLSDLCWIKIVNFF